MTLDDLELPKVQIFSEWAMSENNKKTELLQRWPHDAPNIWLPWKLYVSAKSANNLHMHFIFFWN